MVSVALPLVALVVIVLAVKAAKMKLTAIVLGGILALAAAPPAWGQTIQSTATAAVERANAALHQ